MKATRTEKGPLPQKYVARENEMRPTQSNPADRMGEGRRVLEYAQPNQMVHDYGSPGDGYPAMAPSSATFTRGLPDRATRKRDDEDATIQFGIKRQ